MNPFTNSIAEKWNIAIAKKWMTENEAEYDSAFDLAADCTSFHCAWEDDMSIPLWVTTLAESIKGKDDGNG
jgi:hypothetical protein